MADSSLRDYDRIADRIRLAKQVSALPAIVVEGKDDRRFLGRLTELSRCDFFIAFTRDKVLETAVDLRDLGISNVVCVVDRDFDDEVAEAERQDLPLMSYENSDLESMLWHGLGLDRLIEEVGSEDKIKQFGGVIALRSRAREVLAPLSRLRRANAVNGWGVDFKRLELSSKLNLRTLSLNPQSVCDALWHAELKVSKAQLYAVAQSEIPLATCPRTRLELVRGRDALAVTGVALRRLVGSISQQQAAVDRLEETLRLASDSTAANSNGWLNNLISYLRTPDAG